MTDQTSPAKGLTSEAHDRLKMIASGGRPAEIYGAVLTPRGEAPPTIQSDLKDYLARSAIVSGEGTLSNALTMTGCKTEEDLIDMANVGASLMDSIGLLAKTPGPFQHWAPAQDPAEIVFDLVNALDEAISPQPTAPASDKREEVTGAEHLSNADIMDFCRHGFGDRLSEEGYNSCWEELRRRLNAPRADAKAIALRQPPSPLGGEWLEREADVAWLEQLRDEEEFGDHQASRVLLRRVDRIIAHLSPPTAKEVSE